MQNVITDFRKELDCFINSICLLRPTREVSLANTNLQMSFSWLGESLKHIGGTTPYINSENPGNRVIEQTADHDLNNNLSEPFSTIAESHIARVKYFRSALGAYIKKLESFKNSDIVYDVVAPPFRECLAESWKAIVQCKHWLGFELARIKNELNNISSPAPAKDLPL